MLSEQFEKEVIEAAVKTYAQGERSVVVNDECGTVCVYFNPQNNHRCAIGHMMTDEEVSVFGNHDGCIDNLALDGWRRGAYSLDQRTILRELQGCHDGAICKDYRGHFLSLCEMNLPDDLSEKIVKACEQWEKDNVN